MVEFDLKVPKRQNIVWLPKQIVNSLGHRLKVVPDSVCAVISAKDCDLNAVLKSLAVIEQGLRLRLELAEKRGVQ